MVTAESTSLKWTLKEENLESFPEVLPFSQLHLEIHVDPAGRSFTSVYEIWEGFEAKGLRPFKKEINLACANLTHPTCVNY